MAALAARAQGGVIADQGESGLFLMVEVLLIQGADVDVHALVLDVADLAIAGHFPVDALLDLDSQGHGRMAGQAFLGADFLPRRVALLAIFRAFELRMGRGKLPRRRLGGS